MLTFPQIEIPIQEIPLDFNTSVRLFIKREDLIHTEISGNKYWKLFFNVNTYLASKPRSPLLITFGGAFSNHIASVSAFGKIYNIPTIGIIRGEELEDKWQGNPTLKGANEHGMELRFVSRKAYQEKAILIQNLQNEFPNALIIPEGGTNENAVEGIQYMLGNSTQDFDYLCSPVGTGGTLAGISKFARPNQKVIGFKVVADENLGVMISKLSGNNNFELIEAHDGRYGKINEENVRFINSFYQRYKVPLDPIYTGKMMKKLIELIKMSHFPENSNILAFHTGGLQGVEGANQMLIKKNKTRIEIK